MTVGWFLGPAHSNLFPALEAGHLEGFSVYFLVFASPVEMIVG